MRRVQMGVMKLASATIRSRHLIPLALRAAAGKGDLQVYGTGLSALAGTPIRAYVNVVDLAEAHVIALQHLASGKPSFIVNLGTRQESSVKKLIHTVEELTGKKVPARVVPRRPGDPPALVADPTQAQKLLNWKTKRTFARQRCECLEVDAAPRDDGALSRRRAVSQPHAASPRNSHIGRYCFPPANLGVNEQRKRCPEH